MSHYIKDIFTKEFPIVVDQNIYKQYIMLMYSFETRQRHPNVLNSPYIGLDPIYFTSQDIKNLFDLFDVDMEDFKLAIKKCPSIDKTHKVTSDPYNLMITYAMHRTFNSTLKEDEKYALMMAFAKMLHYKFFTSLVYRRFPFGANEAIMKATINNLSEKFDLVKYGTWKLTIEARCQDLIDRKSIHYNTFKNYDVDNGSRPASILYLISDTQTRLRNRINTIVEEYHNNRSSGNIITSHTLSKEIDGEKMILDQVGTLDTMITNISNQVLNINQWIDNNHVRLCASLFSNVNESLLKQFLTSFSQYAALQVRTGKLDMVKKDKNMQLYLGARILMKAILQKTYRMCIQSKDVDMRNKLSILNKAKNVYAASRITDINVIEIKESIGVILNDCVKVQREATRASLRIAFIVYIMLKSFEYL